MEQIAGIICVILFLSIIIHIILCNVSKKYNDCINEGNYGDFICDC